MKQFSDKLNQVLKGVVFSGELVNIEPV